MSEFVMIQYTQNWHYEKCQNRTFLYGQIKRKYGITRLAGNMWTAYIGALCAKKCTRYPFSALHSWKAGYTMENTEEKAEKRGELDMKRYYKYVKPYRCV